MLTLQCKLQLAIRHCAFHIQQNLIKKLKRKLNSKWDDFIREFYALQNSLVISDFENHWVELMVKYQEIQKYFKRVLYLNKQCCVHGFIKNHFLYNTHLNQL